MPAPVHRRQRKEIIHQLHPLSRRPGQEGFANHSSAPRGEPRQGVQLYFLIKQASTA
jgi:hypothetical protein